MLSKANDLLINSQLNVKPEINANVSEVDDEGDKTSSVINCQDRTIYKLINVDKHSTNGTLLVDRTVDKADGQVLVDMVDKTDSQTLVDVQSDTTKSELAKVTDKTVTTDTSDVNPTVNDVNKLDNILNPMIVELIFTDDNPSINGIDDANKSVISIPVNSDANTTVNIPVDSEADITVRNLVDSEADITFSNRVDSSKETTVDVSADNSADPTVDT